MLLIGLDAAVPGRWRRLVDAGLLPVGRRLLAKGFHARCLPAMPTLTTTNWATIATGAWPGTHGVTDFNPHRPGDVPDTSPQGFDARATRAEFIWEAAVRAGRRAVVVNWPGSWPPRRYSPEVTRGSAGARSLVPGSKDHHVALDQGDRLVIVGGAGIELDEWRIGMPGRERVVALAAEQRFSTLDEPGGTLVTLGRAGEPFDLPLRYDASYMPVEPPVTLVGRLGERAGRPVVRLSLKGRPEALAELAEGEWSERLVLPFRVGTQKVEAAFRAKLLALDSASGVFRLYVTDISQLAWLEHPAGVLDDPSRFAGLPTPGVGWESLSVGRIDVETFVELEAMATTWLTDVCVELLERAPSDLFCAHLHAIDSFYHLCSGPLTAADTPEPLRDRLKAAEEAVYRQLDEAIGRILAAAGESVLTVLVSDHGATPPGPAVPLRRILQDAGLLATLPPSVALTGTAPGGAVMGDGDAGAIDWSRTLAAPQGTCYVRVNVADREPYGIVDASHADVVCRQVVEALLAYRDPASGACPFGLVADREEAARHGLRGDGVGDVFYALRPEFSDVHGPLLPDAMLPSGDWGMPALCLFSGMGAARGVDLDTEFALVDVAPTISRAMGIAPPRECDGVVRPELLAGDAALESRVPSGAEGSTQG